MAEEEKKEEAGKDENAASAELGGTKKIIIMAVIILGIMGVMSAVSIMVIMSMKPEDPELVQERIKQQKDEQERLKATGMGTTLGDPIEILVNMAGPDSERFLKAELVLEYETANEAAVLPLIESRLPKLKDIAIGVLSSCEVADVNNRTGKRKALTLLKNEMNKIFPEPETITNVYFDGFVIQ